MPMSYLYRITNQRTGEYYLGVRTTESHWSEDPYMGSGRLLKIKMKANPEDTWDKSILMLFRDKDKAYEYEKLLVGQNFIGGQSHDGLCLNMREGGEGGRTRFQSSWSLISPEGDEEHVGVDQIVAKLKTGFRMKSALTSCYFIPENKVYRLSSSQVSMVLLHHSDDWELGCPPGIEAHRQGKKSLAVTQYLADARNCVKLRSACGDVVEVARYNIPAYLADGYNFSSVAVRIHNKKAQLWTRQSAATAKGLILSNNGWEYGKPHHLSLTHVNINEIKEF